MTFDRDGYALAAGAGENLWFFNSLASIKVVGEHSHGAVTVVELQCPAQFGPPPHTHEREDEMFYVLEGQLNVRCGEKAWTVEPGGLAFLPRQIAHTFTTGPTGVRMLQLTSPAQFEGFVRDMGAPADSPTLPAPEPVDVAQLLEVSPRYGMRFELGEPT